VGLTTRSNHIKVKLLRGGLAVVASGWGADSRTESLPLRKFMRLPATMAATGESRSTIYSKIKAGTFPKPVKLGPKAVGWVEDEIAAYNEAKIAARDAAQ
jgi:prophage regulatory protein